MLSIRYLKQDKLEFDSFDTFKERFLNVLSAELKEIESFVEVDIYSISFTRKINLSNQGNSKIFRVMRKGKISLTNENNHIIITSYVELQEHLYFSFFLGVLGSLALGYNFNFKLNLLTNFSIFITLSFFILGYIKAKFQLDNLLKRSIHFTYSTL